MNHLAEIVTCPVVIHARAFGGEGYWGHNSLKGGHMTPRHRPPRHIGPTPRQRTIAQCSAIAARHRTIVTDRPLTMKDIRGPLRWKEIVKARAEVARFLREERGWSFPQIGKFLGRDHTSIMNLLNPDGRVAKREAYRRWVNKHRANPQPDNSEENSHVEINQ